MGGGYQSTATVEMMRYHEEMMDAVTSPKATVASPVAVVASPVASPVTSPVISPVDEKKHPDDG